MLESSSSQTFLCMRPGNKIILRYVHFNTRSLGNYNLETYFENPALSFLGPLNNDSYQTPATYNNGQVTGFIFSFYFN